MNDHSLLFLHGWGTHPIIWEPLGALLPGSQSLPLPGYAGTDPAETLEEMAYRIMPHIKTQSTLVGWSLGGQVAVRFALDFPEKLSRLVLIGTTPCFVSRHDWPYGVADDVFEQFSRNLTEDYAGTIRRFLSLQAQGSDAVRMVLGSLRTRLLKLPPPTTAVLEAGLAILRGTDLRKEVVKLALPVTLIHGVGDRLVPVGAARWLARMIPGSRLHEIKGAGHAPFLSHAAEVANLIVHG